MTKGLAKYKIGLLVLGLFTIGLIIVVLIQANNTKQDNNTYNQASKIADTLNNYISTKNVIPSSLAVAGANDVPATVSYQKLSSSSFKFCVDYKTVSSGFDATGVESDVITGGSNGDFSDGASSDDTTLFIDTTHNKGENCQTIKPYLYTSDPALVCQTYYNQNSTDNNQSYYNCLDNLYNTVSPTPTETNPLSN